MSIGNQACQKVLDDLIKIIEETKSHLIVQANSSLIILLWNIGKRIGSEIIENNRAEYGKQIVVLLTRELTSNFGNSFKDKNVRRIIQFFEKFPDFENVITFSRNLSYHNSSKLYQGILKR